MSHKDRVYEVAKRLNLAPNTVVGLFQAIGALDVRNLMSVVEPEDVERLVRHLAKAGTQYVEERARNDARVVKRRAIESTTTEATPTRAGVADAAPHPPPALPVSAPPTISTTSVPAPPAYTGTPGPNRQPRDPIAEQSHGSARPATPVAALLTATGDASVNTLPVRADVLLRAATARARQLDHDARLRAALGLARIALQHCAIPIVEWVLDHATQAAHTREQWELREPTDGNLVDMLAHAVVHAENAGWSGARGGLWITRSSAAATHFVGKPATLHDILNQFVAARNDGLEGHGIAGGEDPEALLSLVDTICADLTALLPISEDGSLLALTSPDGRRTRVSYLRLSEGDLVCYRRSRFVRAGVCRVTAQRRTGLLEKAEILWDADDKLQAISPLAAVQYEFAETQTPKWSPLARIPERVTRTFTGRQAELKQLWEWFNDTQSRACIVYGDGGIGKTTLVVEFLHRLLSGDLGDPTWQPKLISYHSAKRTRWGLSGLEPIRFGSIGLSDAVTEIVRNLEGHISLEQDWFKVGFPPLAQKLGGYLQRWGVEPSSHMLILDNTETLASEESEVTLLADHIKTLARRVGRVIVTSRRREKLEAEPIELQALDAENAERLLRHRAAALKCVKLADAPAHKIRKYVHGFEGRPLLLEVFVQTLAEKGLSPDQGFQRVRQMQTKDLGDFLYADAWSRFPDSLRHLLLLMVSISDTHDETMLRLCAREAEVAVLSAEQALEESHGIARMQRIAGKVHVTFRTGFLAFCQGRTIEVKGTKLPQSKTVARVRAAYNDYLRVRDEEIADRVGKAFRTPFAKMAWSAFASGRYDDCEAFYEQAIAEDPNNGLLFDRYALFLLRKRHDPERALGKSERATELAEESPEVWFTRGMIQSMLKAVDPACNALSRAMELGKEAHLVWVQIAYACTRAVPPREALARDALRKSRAASPPEEAAEPHWRELKQFEKRLRVSPV